MTASIGVNWKYRLIQATQHIVQLQLARNSQRGIDPCHDISVALPDYRPGVVFDVGANVGQSTRKFLTAFPGAPIYCFEPVRATFDTLRRNMANIDRVRVFQVAFGATQHVANMEAEGTSTRNRLLAREVESDGGQSPTHLEAVDVVTIDEFCRTQRIDRIGYLKIDTEGSDLDVLVGAQSVLGDQRVDFVEAEVGMNPSNTDHVPMEKIKTLLEGHGYSLFGIYEQRPEWRTRRPQLRRSNLVFMSQRL